MRGFPKSLATKRDYMNCMKMYPEETKRALRSLLSERYVWVEVSELSEGEDGTEDEGHRVDERDGKRLQMERREDPAARLFLLGFTVAEASALCG